MQQYKHWKKIKKKHHPIAKEKRQIKVSAEKWIKVSLYFVQFVVEFIGSLSSLGFSCRRRKVVWNPHDDYWDLWSRTLQQNPRLGQDWKGSPTNNSFFVFRGVWFNRRQVWFLAGAFIFRVCMLSFFLCGFLQSPLASSESPKTYKLGLSVALNHVSVHGCLTPPMLSPMMKWWHVQDISCLHPIMLR